METLHYTRQLSDHSPGMTLCGIRLTTDHAKTSRIASQPTGWITCPLCEAAALLDGLDARGRPDDPRAWHQPTIFDIIDETNQERNNQ